MGNKFDMISADPSGSINNLNLLNETFHVFSKSPASDVTTLGGARLKSGHTTTASDVWADEIPAFFNAANQAKFDLFSTLAVKDDLCIFGGNVYQHNGTQFVSLGAEAEVLVDGKTFSKNNKPVVKYHKGRTAINLSADNNNGDGSNNLSAKIYDAATGSTNFVSQFISSTDKMVAGVPSLGYDATVIAGGVKLAEGLTNDNDYICNAYAGVIQFNTARLQNTVTVSAWEYIGDKLTTSLNKIREDVQDIIDTTMEGVVASVGVTTDASNAGISIDSTAKTSPKVDITLGAVANAETKLVSGGAIKTYVDTAIQSAAITVNNTAGVKNITVTGTTDEIDVTPSGEGTSKTLTLSLSGKVATTDTVATAKSEAIAAAKTETTGQVSAAKTEIKGITDSLATRISNLEGVSKFQVVIRTVEEGAPTPETATENTIYLVPSEKATGSYVEWLAYKEGDITKIEQIGSTEIDLSDYAKTADVNASLATKAAASDLTALTTRVTTAEGTLANKANTADVYSKTVADNTFAAKSNTYTKSEVDTKVTEATLTLKAGTLSASSGEVTISGGTGVDVSASNNTVTVALNSDTQTTINNKADISTVTALSEIVASNKSAADTGIEEAKTVASTAQTTANEAKSTTDTINASYVKSINGKKDTVVIYGDGGHSNSDGNTHSNNFGSYGAVDFKSKDNNELHLSVNALWNGGDSSNASCNLTTTVINCITDNKLFVNFEKLHYGFNFNSNALKTFISDLPNLVSNEDSRISYASGGLTKFRGNLGNLETAVNFFSGCTLDDDSVMYIADGIKDWSELGGEHPITIDVANTSSAAVKEYLDEIAAKGWTVASNHNAYAASGVSTDGTSTAVYVIARPAANEDRATHITSTDEYVTVETAISVIGPHQHLWKLYASLEDAVLDMDLRPIA